MTVSPFNLEHLFWSRGKLYKVRLDYKWKKSDPDKFIRHKRWWPNVFNPAFNRLLDSHCGEKMVGGGFNLVLDSEKDKKGGLVRTRKLSLAVIKAFSEDLRPNWRLESSRKPEVHLQAWFFFFLVNQNAFCNITGTSILIPAFKANHSVITLEMSLYSNTSTRC